MLTRGECAPQCNSLLPANQKDVLAHVQQRSPLIFHQHCSGNVSHSLLQWHWASPGEHMAFCSTPSLRSHCLRLHQLLLSLRGSIYLGFFCPPGNHTHFSQWVLLAFSTKSQESAAGPALLGCGCQKEQGSQPDPHLHLHPNRDGAVHEGWRRNSAVTPRSCCRRNCFGAQLFKAASLL